MDRSTKHEDARIAACRIPALTASLNLLNTGASHSTISLYADPRPSPGAAASASAVVSLQLAAPAGTLNSAAYRIELTVPVEAQITGAATLGTAVTWGRIMDAAGEWWGDVSVSDEAGSGEIKLQTTTLYNGAYARLTSAIIQG